MKKSIDLIGNRTRELPLVAKCLNQLRYRLPLPWYYAPLKKIKLFL
jgi:hypothetical protein